MKLTTFQTYTSTQPLEHIVEQIVDTIRRDDYLKSLTIGYRSSGQGREGAQHTLLPCRPHLGNNQLQRLH